jgi:antitoxin Phd
MVFLRSNSANRLFLQGLLPKTSKKRAVSPRVSEFRTLPRPATTWQAQTAKARFSELFRRARIEGPQLITRQGKEGVVMIAGEQYERLIGTANQHKSLLQFFRESPLVGLELDLGRERDEGRSLARAAITRRKPTRRMRNGVPLSPNTVPVTLDLVNRLRD